MNPLNPLARAWSHLPALALLVLCAPPLSAQGPSWAPVAVVAKFGWDGGSNGSVLGGQLRLPVIPTGRVELLGEANVTFVPQTHDYQYSVEATYRVVGDRQGGIYVGGGFGWRNGIYSTAIGRQTVTTRNVVIGLRTAHAIGILGAQLELRWLFPSEIKVDPQPGTLGLELPLWGWSRPQR